MNPVGKTVFLWGLICLILFSLLQNNFLGFSGMAVSYAATAFLIIGLAAMFKFTPNAWKNSLVRIWFAVIVIGTLITLAYQSSRVNASGWGVLGTSVGIWLLLLGAGFTITGWKRISSFFYGSAACCFLLLLSLHMGIPFLKDYPFLITGIISGIPVMYYGWKS